MAGADDELERLMREVDATLAEGKGKSPAPSNLPATSKEKQASPKGSAPKGRLSRATRSGVVAGAATAAVLFVVVFLFQWLPLVGHPFAAALGAFIAAFVTATYLTYRNDKD